MKNYTAKLPVLEDVIVKNPKGINESYGLDIV